MCRVLGCVAATQVSLRHELLDAPNPLIQQSERHDSGWGMAVYPRGEGEEPQSLRIAEAAFSGQELAAAAELRGRIFNVHVRRATMGGLAPENTHPFCLCEYSFSHNGTIVDYPRLLEPGVERPHGSTDSEVFFNFLFSDGEKLYAYRLGVFELHWASRPGQTLVSSERLTDETWHDVLQDVLLVCDPNDPEEPHAERLVGDAVVKRAHIDDFNDGDHLSGRERGEFAAQRAAKLAGSTSS